MNFYRILRTGLVFSFQVLNCFIIRGLGTAVAFHVCFLREMCSFLGHWRCFSRNQTAVYHLDPILFCTVCFFGVKMAMIASSKTVFNPSVLKLNIPHSSTHLSGRRKKKSQIYKNFFTQLVPHKHTIIRKIIKCKKNEGNHISDSLEIANC